MDLKESDVLGDQIGEHWYYASKARALLALLQNERFRSVLDVGAGSGFFSRYLIENSSAEFACCVDPNYRDEREERHDNKLIRFRRHVASSDADLVLLMDVLEHVDDDVGLLAEYAKLVQAGATFVISVPAFSFLWSDHDDFLEHKRRYTRREIEQVVRSAFLHPEWVVYFFLLVFLVALVTRVLKPRRTTGRSQLRQHSRLVNSLLKHICAFELPFFSHNRLLGLTVFCLARMGARRVS